MANLFSKVIIIILSMSIVTSCDSTGGRSRGANPLLESEWDTPFGIAPFESIEAEDYLEAFDVAFAEQRANIDHIVNQVDSLTFESVIWAIDNSNTRVRDLRDLFEMSEAAISDEGYRRVSETLAPRLAAAEDEIWMNEGLFERVERIYEGRDSLDLNADQQRLLEKIYKKFVRGGAKLSAEQKSRLASINEQIATLRSRFSQNLLAENSAFYLELKQSDMETFSNDLRGSAKQEAQRRGLKEGWIITLNPSSMIPFLTYSPNREQREQIYKAYQLRGANGGESDNRDIVMNVTRLRQERALMLGYENHADYVISEQMAGSVEAAYELLEEVWSAALPVAAKERDELQKLLRADLSGATLEPWDWWYYAEKLREKRYKVSAQSLMPYFSLEMVRGGAFAVANRLYGLAFRPVDVPLYHDDCSAYEVFDRDNTHLGVLYFDLYPRGGKGQGAWCGNLREQRYDGGDLITPVVAIVCNFPRPTDNLPSQLSLEQVETLFHEFGHALHFLMQRVDYRGLAAVEGDFVEFPSQVMENWALEEEVLKMYAIHHHTGAVIPDRLLNSFGRSRGFNQGFETLSMVAAALLDLDLQTTLDLENFDVEEFEREALRERRGMIAEIDPRYHLTNFAHLFTYDYSAGYYFYLWSEVLDKDCFAAFKESGDIFSKRLADALRHEVLERGGEVDGATLYRNFRGADPSKEHLLRSRGLQSESKIEVEK